MDIILNDSNISSLSAFFGLDRYKSSKVNDIKRIIFETPERSELIDYVLQDIPWTHEAKHGDSLIFTLQQYYGEYLIDVLKDKDVEKIRVGDNHSYFLDSAGIVWCCGGNHVGQLGLGHIEIEVGIVQIDFFVRKDVKITEIECGSDFSIMLDDNGCVYGIGNNRGGQLGLDKLARDRNNIFECIKNGNLDDLQVDNQLL